MELDELKLYLRASGTEEDQLITGLQLSAEEYLKNAGVNIDYTRELYKLAIKILVSHWYENRAVQSEKSISKMSFSLDSIIFSLKYTQSTEVTA